MSYFYEYAGDYSPPAPVVEVLIGAAHDIPNSVPYIALLDTGADYSVIPINLIKQVNAIVTGVGTVRGVWGSRREVEIYSVAIKIGTHEFADMDVLADETGNEIILGRTILNHLTITFDGPGQHVEIAE